MGRILDLFGEVAAAVEESPGGGLHLPMEEADRLREDWPEEDIDDAVEMVKDNLLQSELVAAADSLSARLIEMLGAFAKDDAYKQLEAGEARISIVSVAQLARRVDRLEEVLEVYRDTDPPERTAFDALRARIADHGIEELMAVGRLQEMGFGKRPGAPMPEETDDEDE